MTEQRGLAGIRVLEVAGGVGPAYAAKLFADLGADVIRVDGDGDVVRSRPHEVHRWLNTNKRSVTTGLAGLAAEADIVVHDLGPAAAASRNLGYEQLAAANPRLVVLSITPFGMTGPYADYAAEELNVMHGCSWGFLSPGGASDSMLPPLKAPGHHATITTATVAAAAGLAAFERADRTGAGAHVDFSVFGAGAKLTETAQTAFLYQGNDASRIGVKTVVPWSIYQCADGLMQFVCVEQAQWDSLVALMGNPEWASWEVFATNADRRENSDLIELYVAEWMATQTVSDLYVRGQEARICVSPVNTMAQLETDAQLTVRDFFAHTTDGLKLVGPGFQTDQGWWALRSAAPAAGQHEGEGWAPRPPRPALSDGASNPSRPLEGIRVCDFSWVWAGPYCTLHLAHLGADVVRLESPDHLCLFRRLPFNPEGHELGPDTAGVFHMYNTDKRSVGIDLRRAEARQVVERLVAQSDVVVENFAVGTLADLGFSVEDLRRINPDVVVVSLTGYGQNGPSAGYMAYGPVGGAVAGLYAAYGYEGGKAMETGVAVGDPCTGITALWATVAALSARRRNGEVARVDVAMVEAIAATVGELWMEYVATGTPPGPVGNHDAGWAPHNCYPAEGEDRWVTIACTSDESWQALCRVVDPALAADERFATAEGRKANEDTLDKLIASWTQGLDRWEATRLLQSVGVAAFPSLSPADLWGGDPQLAAIGMLERPVHNVVGERTVPGIPWRMTPGPNGLRRAAPTLGQHTNEVLVDLLGYSPAEVEALRNSGALR